MDGSPCIAPHLHAMDPSVLSGRESHGTTHDDSCRHTLPAWHAGFMRDPLRRLTLWIGIVTYVGGLLLTLLIGPDTVPQHIGSSGEVNAWASKSSHVLFMAGLGAFLLLVTVGSKAFVSRVDASWINLPDRAAHAYWTAPANRPRFNRRMGADIDLLMGITFVFVAIISTTVALTAQRTEPAGPFGITSVIAVSIYLAAMIGYCIALAVGRRYAVPDDS